MVDTDSDIATPPRRKNGNAPSLVNSATDSFLGTTTSGVKVARHIKSSNLCKTQAEMCERVSVLSGGEKEALSKSNSRDQTKTNCFSAQQAASNYILRREGTQKCFLTTKGRNGKRGAENVCLPTTPKTNRKNGTRTEPSRRQPDFARNTTLPRTSSFTLFVLQHPLVGR